MRTSQKETPLDEVIRAYYTACDKEMRRLLHLEDEMRAEIAKRHTRHLSGLRDEMRECDRLWAETVRDAEQRLAGT